MNIKIDSEYIYSGLTIGSSNVYKTIIVLKYDGTVFAGKIKIKDYETTFIANLNHTTDKGYSITSQVFEISSILSELNTKLTASLVINESFLIGTMKVVDQDIQFDMNLDRLL